MLNVRIGQVIVYARPRHLQVVVDDSYSIKDTLKADGYKFDPMARAWCKRFPIDAFAAVADAMRGLVSLGAVWLEDLHDTEDAAMNARLLLRGLVTQDNAAEFVAAFAGLTMHDMVDQKKSLTF